MTGAAPPDYPAGPEQCLASTTEAALWAGVTFRRAGHWAATGAVHPFGGGSPGSPWYWLPREIEVARRIGVLTAAGIEHGRAVEFARDGWPDGPVGPAGLGVRLTVREHGGERCHGPG